MQGKLILQLLDEVGSGMEDICCVCGVVVGVGFIVRLHQLKRRRREGEDEGEGRRMGGRREGEDEGEGRRMGGGKVKMRGRREGR